MSDDTESIEKSFSGWFIPRDIVYLFDDGTLSADELILLAMVDSLARKNENGCFASNQYFADRFKVKKDTASRMIAKLIKMELLVQVGFDGRRRFLATSWSADTYKKALSIRSRVGRISDAALDENPIVPSLKRGITNKYNTASRAAKPARGMRGGFFGSKDAPTFVEVAAQKLEQMIRENRKLQAPPNRKGWVDEMDKLDRMIGDRSRIRTVIKWYGTKMGQKYVPIAYCAKTFREKFLQIEDAMRRDQERNNAKLDDPFEPTPDDLETFEYLKDEIWPMGSKSQLLECIHYSLLAARAWRAKVWKLHDSLQDGSLRHFIEHMQWSLTNSADRIVVLWFQQVSLQVKNWKDWNGDLRHYIFTTEHKMFQKMGRKECAEFAGQSSTLWQELMDRINEN